METHTISNFRPLLRTFYLFLSAIAVLWAVPRNTQTQLYVLQTGSPGNGHIGTVSEYSTNGELINANLITGLNDPTALAVSGNTLFVTNNVPSGTVGKFDATTGATINAKFIKGLDLRVAKGNTLYGLVGFHHNTVAEYDAINGSAINPSLITGLKFPSALAVLGNKIFVAEYERDRVGEYDATTGAVINANFITGTMDFPIAIAVKRTK